MYKVDINNYPNNKDWNEKAFSMPNLPRGENGMKDSLKIVLSKVRDGESPKSKLNIKGSSSNLTLQEACVRLRPLHLINKTATGWVLTEESKTWLESEDDNYLAAIFNSNVRFFGEILTYIDNPKKASELQDIANESYGLYWKTKSDINTRLYWLRELDLIEFQKYSLLYSITEKGIDFINNIDIIPPLSENDFEDPTNNESSITISDWAVELVKNKNSNDLKQSIGYIPGNNKDCFNTIADFLTLIGKGITSDRINQFASNNYSLKPSSTRSFLTLLNNLNLIRRSSDTKYAITNLAEQWLETKNPMDLICIIHANVLYVFELLGELSEEPKTNKELHAIARAKYQYMRQSHDDIQMRIKLLTAAQLIRYCSRDQVALTNRGKLVVSMFGTSIPVKLESDMTNTQTSTNSVDGLIAELHLAASDSSNFERLEKAVKQAFELLGFNSEWISGSGNTDVLLTAPTAPTYSYKVTVDAKSTSSQTITDALVDFDTLLEHKKKHKADYIVVVGKSFASERLIKRAVKHSVLLLDVDNLEKLIREHIRVPLKVDIYRNLFECSGIANINILDEYRKQVYRYGILMQGSIDCLIQESLDPITKGYLTEVDIYRSLRNNPLFDPLPTLEEIGSILELLSSPIIGCVAHEKNGYYIIGSIEDVKRKFEFYASMCE